jgi:5-methylcytosine-specific restriction enzyme subunit McrC
MEQLFLYEWQWKKLPPDFDSIGLKTYLSKVWESRNVFFQEEEGEQTEEEESDLKRYKQGFIRFDGGFISAKNYVGFIQYNGVGINIFPKVFAKTFPDPFEHIHNITSNLLHWLKYSTRIRFPFSEVSYEQQHFDHLLEPFIFIFAEYTNRLLEKLPYQCFEEITEPTSYLKGRLATNRYISESLVTGNFQHIISTYDSFEFNNRFNQIIKFVANLLAKNTSNDYSLERLQNILFMLDEVEDVICSDLDCDKIHFNRIYDEWNTILNMCRMFLANQSFKSQDLKKPNFCFLVPMELVYEEYVAGILEKYSNKNIQRQPSYKYLTDENLFRLKPDIIYDDRIIIDTKYKILDLEDFQNKFHISQTDLYQMVSYAVRYNKKEIILVYPDDNLMNNNPPVQFFKEFKIKDDLSNQTISIKIKIIDISSREDFDLATLICDDKNKSVHPLASAPTYK